MIKKIWNNYIWRNKYIISTLFFILWILFIDRNSFLDKQAMKKHLSELKKEKAMYTEKIYQDSIKLLEIKSNNEYIERFARENFFMKKPNEDIFVIVQE